MNIPRSEPEKHHGVELIDVRYADRRKHEEKNDVAKNEVGCKHAQLGDFAKIFSGGLRHGMPAH